MTTFFMISGYGFTVLKVFIFFILLHAVYPTFKYRYALLISCVAAPFYTQINDYLLYTMLSILLYILILFIGGCILVRKNFFCFNTPIHLLCTDGRMYRTILYHDDAELFTPRCKILLRSPL